METKDYLRAWGRILAGRTPFLSIEITKECPLRCPGCYAYGDDHLGGSVLLRQVRDYRGEDLVNGILHLVDEHRPLHVSLVGGEPLVRFRELCQLLPLLSARGVHTQVVTSAVRPIPLEWRSIPRLTITVSIDGLQPEHDARRKPATYDRILKHIEGHRIVVHCTITRQMTERPGYLREFVEFWSAREEVRKVWMSIFTPQKGETSYEILPPDVRLCVIDELLELSRRFKKLELPRRLLDVYRRPPASPQECAFARATRSITADLRRSITPCHFGGDPDCSQCGCIASAAMSAVSRYVLPTGIEVNQLFQLSQRIGGWVATIRESASLKPAEADSQVSEAGS